MRVVKSAYVGKVKSLFVVGRVCKHFAMYRISVHLATNEKAFFVAIQRKKPCRKAVDIEYIVCSFGLLNTSFPNGFTYRQPQNKAEYKKRGKALFSGSLCIGLPLAETWI
jgi:hypothetical protein